MKLNEKVVKELYLNHMRVKNYSDSTIRGYSLSIHTFFNWLNENENKSDLRDVKREDILKYKEYLSKVKNRNKKNFLLSIKTQKERLSVLKGIFTYLVVSEYVLFNPFDTIDLKRIEVKKSRDALSIKEMNTFLDSIDVSDIIRIRDKALFELMYGTGLRVSEVSNLNVTDIDFNMGKLIVIEGKGKKDRIIPIGSNVIKILQFYLKRSRRQMLNNVKDAADKQSLFFTVKGKRMNSDAIRIALKKRFKEAGLDERKVSPHVIRHSFATHLLENGASLKHVKELLGHTLLETTVTYTHFNIKSLKRISKKYHPRENELYLEFEEDEELLNILSKKNKRF